MGTGGTPAPIIARIDKEFAKALDLPEVKDAFAKQGVELFYMNSATLGQFWFQRPTDLAACSSIRSCR